MTQNIGVPFDFTAYVFGNAVTDATLDAFANITQTPEKQTIIMENIPEEILDNMDSTQDDVPLVEDLSTPPAEGSDDATTDNGLGVQTQHKKKKKHKKSKSFKLKDYSGLSSYTKWLLSFDVKDLESKIEHAEEKRKRKLFKKSINKSIEKSNIIITEPLADVMAKQGHIDDAKKMYAHLMHKYPEKSSYFAAKIENLIK